MTRKLVLTAALAVTMALLGATIAVAAFGYEDVSAHSVHGPNIEEATALGLMQGRGDTDGDGQPEFAPAQPLRRDQGATVAVNQYHAILQATQVTWHKTEVALPANTTTTVDADCPEGTVADTGGLDISATNGATEVRHDGPVLVNSDTPDEHIAHTWRVTVRNLSDDPGNVAAYVGCTAA